MIREVSVSARAQITAAVSVTSPLATPRLIIFCDGVREVEKAGGERSSIQTINVAIQSGG
jgi:hypothetical protein